MTHSTIIQDDFFEDPDDIRRFALQQEYEPCPVGKWPGKRTELLRSINADFAKYFVEKLVPIRFVGVRSVDLASYFHIIPKFSDDPSSILNRGFVHIDAYDGNSFNPNLSGVVYLTPGIHKRCGTSTFQLKPHVDQSKVNMAVAEKHALYKSGVLVEDFYKKVANHYDQFEETVRVDNIYNRLVTFDTQIWHGANNFHSGIQEDRLTLVWFAKTK